MKKSILIALFVPGLLLLPGQRDGFTERGPQREAMSDAELQRELYYSQERAHAAIREEQRQILMELKSLRTEVAELRAVCRR
ncbi:hypothetical protein [Pelomicrobium sp.]|jgi:hypothetical protein|uniref:hypothetical protein n=1 Tax=Pelomicrobium sp. TaxID=2815319 RepID=UPI002FDD6872